MSTQATTRPRQKRRWPRRLAIVAAILIVLWLALSLAVAYCLTHRIGAIQSEDLPPITWARLESARLEARDGIGLGAWAAEGRPARAAVLILHGNGAGRSAMLGIGRVFSDRGHPVLLLTLRAHGDSEGQVNDFGRSAAADVIAAVEWMQTRWPDRNIIIYGESLGAAAAMFASEQLGHSVSGYILVCPYTDLRTAVRNRTRIYLPPGLDRLAYAGLLITSPLVLPDALTISPSDALARAPATVSILLLAGQQDQHTTLDQIKAIHHKVATHATLQVLSGKHLQMRTLQQETFDRIVTDFAEDPSTPTGRPMP